MAHTEWWKDGAIYHIYPRSFLDTNGDGFGDLNGITARLGYLQNLGIDAVWMGPIFRSPQVDNGYDIADYKAVDTRFGSNEDLDRLIAEAHRRDIRVLLDLVFNHTSDQHRWFQASRRRKAEHVDYYIWRDRSPDGGPPNDWGSFFTRNAWSWDTQREQYYLHLFAPEQPDLNWENPRVREELAAVANFWIERGVDGFRMDVINMISKAPGLPALAGGTPSGVYIDGPRVLTYLQEFRDRLHRSREIVLVGETPGITAAAAKAYTAVENRALDMVLLFDHLNLDHGPGGRWDHRSLEIRELRDTVALWQGHLERPSWPSVYMSNHDQPRIVSRYGDDDRFRYESATALATVFYLQRGTPIIYQGDEIGMANFPITGPEDIVDIESGNAYRHLIEDGVSPETALLRVRRNARDNGRTPMQWSDAPHAGFTPDPGAEPWFPVNPDYRRWNVAAQSNGFPATVGNTATSTAESVLRYYQRLLALRREHPLLRRGIFVMIPPRDDNVPAITYRRELDAKQLVVTVNLSGGPIAIADAWPEYRGTGVIVLGNYPDRLSAASGMAQPAPITEVRPWEALVIGEFS